MSRLRTRSLNSKSAKDRHDNAWYAFELSMRIAVATTAGIDFSRLRESTFESWVELVESRPCRLASPEDLALARLLDREGSGRDEPRDFLSGPDLLVALADYRARVVGQSAARSARYYLDAAPVLLAGLESAWRAGVFLPRESRLVWIESIELDDQARPRAAVVDLSGESPRLVDPSGVEVHEGLRPRRLYLQTPTHWRSLHPWLLYREGDERTRESFFCFNGFDQAPEYLDFGSGESLRGEAIAEEWPTALEELSEALGLVASAPVARDESEPEGDRFGAFEILGKLGEGGMGVVYLARLEALDRLVALKMLPSASAEDPTAVARFRREVNVLSRCEHPNLVRVLDSGRVGDTWFYAMEYVEGVDLAQVVAELGSAPRFDDAVDRAWRHLRAARQLASMPDSGEARAVESSGEREPVAVVAAKLVRDAAMAVHQLHDAGVVHRDIKPANLMITRADHRVVVMDLGLAAIENASVSLSGNDDRILGTLRYLAPEQLHTRLAGIDKRVDVHALGAVLYELLACRPMIDGDNELRVLEQILHEEPTPIRQLAPFIPRDLATIVHKAIAKDPRARYESAAALARDLDNLVLDRPIEARPPSVGYLLRLAIRRNRPVAITSAVALALLLMASLFYASSITRAVRAKERAMLSSELMEALTDAPEHIALADTLLPAAPRTIPRIDAWLDKARGLTEHLPVCEQELDPLRERTVALDGEQLRELRAQLRELEGVIPQILQRRVESERLPSITLDDPAWDAAIQSVASMDRYRTPDGEPLELEPQLGLLPLGVNPDGLWEFWMPASGARPEVGDAERGAYAMDAASAVVLVLLPPSRDFSYGQGRTVRSEEQPAIDLDLDAFFLSKYEVTQAQYERVMGVNPARFSVQDSDDIDTYGLANPVESVDWTEASTFARYLDVDLPTEPQWEYGCRADTSTTWWFGNGADSAYAYENVWTGRSHSQFQPRLADRYSRHATVGSLEPNPFGLFDLHGNVAEWCRDAWGQSWSPEDFHPGDGARIGEPTRFRTYRGGAYNTLPEKFGIAVRGFTLPGTRSQAIGLRVARPIR